MAGHVDSDAIIATDISGRIIFLNLPAERLTGWKNAEAAGRAHDDVVRFLNGKTREKLESPLSASLRGGGETPARGPALLIAKDGSETPVEINAAPMAAKSGAIMVMQDCGPREKRELEDFVTSVSHDLRSPVGSIIQLAQLLEMDYSEQLDKHGNELITTISACGKRMLTLLQGLLEYSQALASAPEDVPPAAANAQLDAAIANLKAQIESSGAKVTNDTLPEARVAPVHLIQMFQNLISNAIYYRSAQPPHIHISAQRDGAMWRFSVSDNGKGIEEKFFGLIFQPFKRVDSTNKEGAGLGLALCRKIVERAGGRIWVDSQPGKGSTFYFTLPAA
jgi:PAS domain S-box-containing protein